MAPTLRLLITRPPSRIAVMPVSFFITASLPMTRPCGRHALSIPTSASMPISLATCTRTLHSSTKANKPPPISENLALDPASLPRPPNPEPEDMAKSAPLSVLPLTTVLRSLMTTTVSSSPFLLPPSLALMSLLANTTRPALNPDRNPILRYLLKKTFYAQFCAGENATEVRQTIAALKKIGFSGVILGYAKEVVLTAAQTRDLAAITDDSVRAEVTSWATGTLETVRLASSGDFVALKFTGAGRQALFALSQRQPPSDALDAAINEICQLAEARGVRLLFDAEQQVVQAGIDDWTLRFMRRYNTADKAVVYGTYQAYLKKTPVVLSAHLALARAEGFKLGVKLVRGAYLGSDPRELIHDTKDDTDRAYNGIVEGLLRRTWQAPLVAPDSGHDQFPALAVVLASHNRETVVKARGILEELEAQKEQQQEPGKAGGIAKADVAFAQLQGMADEVSCELVASGDKSNPVRPQAYKYLVWGSTGECMKYLLRRAQENRDAVQRTKSGRDAMQAELMRRVKAMFGISV